jgi:hypothetical protein
MRREYERWSPHRPGIALRAASSIGAMCSSRVRRRPPSAVASQDIQRPPFTASVWPVMYRLASLARNAMA